MNEIDLSKQYGVNLQFPTSKFTKEMQGQIVDNYFNGTGSVYHKVLSNEVAMNENATSSNYNERMNQMEQELERLRELERNVLVSEYSRQQPERMTQPPQQPTSELPLQNESQQSNNSDDPLAKLMNEVMGTKSNDQPVMPGQDITHEVKQEQYRNSMPSPTENAVREISYYAQKKGYNPKDVIEFVNSISPMDMITLYEAVNSVQPQQSIGSQSQQQTKPQAPVNLSEMPRAGGNLTTGYMPNNIPRNPFFG